MLLEVPVDSLRSACVAVYSLCDELQVSAALPHGGITPPVGLVKNIIDMIDEFMVHTAPRGLQRPKVNVMINCRVNFEFCYDFLQTKEMLADVDHFKTMKIDGFVFGCLDKNQDLDYDMCVKFIDRAKPLPVTFHKAFDLCRMHHVMAATDLVTMGFSRILTSGKQTSVSSRIAKYYIRDLVRDCGNEIQIMPGGGLTPSDLRSLKKLGCPIVHSSCRAEEDMPKDGEDGGSSSAPVNNVTYVTEGKTVRRLIASMNKTKEKMLITYDCPLGTSFEMDV